MDPRLAKQHLYHAERNVTLGRQHIARQHQIIADLRRNGRDLTEAMKLLATFESLQTQHEEHRDRLLQELGDVE